MQASGDRDICFYNERCYVPSTVAGDFPFNLLSSNIPYVLHGALIGLTYLIIEGNCNERGHAGFYDYSLAYAVAWAFIFEGVFSTIYHICPTRMIFQFDTAFMFVIAAILFSCLLQQSTVDDQDCAIYETREELRRLVPARNAKSFRPIKVVAFFLVPIFLFNYLGSVRDVEEMRSSDEIVFYFFLLLWLLLILLWGIGKFAVVPKSLERLHFTCSLNRRPSLTEADEAGRTESLRSPKLLLLFYVFASAILGWLLYVIIMRRDMSIFFMGLCMLPLIVTLVFYEVSTFHSRPEEKPSMLFLFYCLVIVLCCSAWYFFAVVGSSNKTKSPAENRDINKDCIFMGFYDSHSVWHFLSSNALLLIGLRAIVLSDPCKICKYERLMKEQKNKDDEEDERDVEYHMSHVVNQERGRISHVTLVNHP